VRVEEAHRAGGSPRLNLKIDTTPAAF